MIAERYQEVENLIQQGQYDQAAMILRIEKNDSDSDYLLALIIDYLSAEIKEAFEVTTYFELLLKSSTAGNIKAMKLLADCYLRPSQFHTKDDERAFFWYKKAFESGNSQALMPLIDCYIYGIGTDINYDEAIRLRKLL